MRFKSYVSRYVGGIVLLVSLLLLVRVQGQNNVTIRVMAANITSGNLQSYEAEGIRIFQGLKPDIVAIQEFQYGGSIASNDLRTLVDTAFGNEFSFYLNPITESPTASSAAGPSSTPDRGTTRS